MWATPNPGQILYSILYKENNHFSPPENGGFHILGLLKAGQTLGRHLHSTVNSRANSSLEVETEPKEAICLTSSPAVAGPLNHAAVSQVTLLKKGKTVKGILDRKKTVFDV